MEIKKIIHERKSPLSFISQNVEQEKITAIVESGNFAPIYGSINFTVIENQNLLNLIKATTISIFKNMGGDFAKAASNPSYDPLYGAPIAIVLSALNGNDSQGFNMANVSCAAQNMILMATDMGIGSRYVMAPVMALLSSDILSQLNIPEDYVPLCMVLLGHTNENILVERSHETTNINYIR
ncbi:nitroreductase family protein [Lactonifactor longoviformis]|uniref:nitroreductase family protein n=1 Tax=Lactonifactor longoviformis TaxID=341220 RepID=UPI0036F31A84